VTLSIGEDTINFFQEGIGRYANVDNFCLGKRHNRSK
jgi:hypothetical protein